MEIEGKGKCLNCGFEPPSDANFCPSCGAARQRPSATNPPPRPPSDVVRGMGYTLGGCMFLILVLVFTTIVGAILIAALAAIGSHSQ